MGSPGNICTICGAHYEPNALFCPRDGAPLGARAPKGADDLLGIELPGQVRIERLIGIGSMGRVYRGFQSGMGRPVAVKVLHRELSGSPTLVARFHREAQIASRLSHPNVVQGIMAGQLPDGAPGWGAMYLVMEYVDGISLRSALAAVGGALPLPRALRIVLQLCEAVGEAHGAGVVHRDLKPENVMLLKRGDDADFVKVLDFGIARLPGGNTPAVTQAGAVFGTARYVSPEGAIGSPVGPSADVYAIATILYQALAGRTPFDGETTVEVLGRQINDAPPDLRSIERARYVPDALASLVMQNLAKRAEDRSSDARALGVALIGAARASGLSSEQLALRSSLLDRGGKQSPFSPSETTRQQEFGVALANKIAAASNQSGAADDRSAATRGAPNASSAGAEGAPNAPSAGAEGAIGGLLRSSRGPLALVVGCVAGGAALAAGVLYVQDPAGHSASPTASPEPPGAGLDAGPKADGGAP